MAKKRTKASVPKRLAGVKIPKSVRRALKDVAASPSGKAVIAEALAAAGAALAASQVKPDAKIRSTTPDKKPSAKAAAKDVVDRNVDNRVAASLAFEEATRTFTETLRRRSGDAAATPKMAEEPSGSTH